MKDLPSFCRLCTGMIVAALSVATASAQEQQPPNLLGFAHGVVPVAVDAGATGAGMEQALKLIDGDPRGFVVTPKPGDATTHLAFVYQLPAPTVFESFTVPNILETPSPAQTFVRTVVVSGSDSGPEGPFHELAATTLATHQQKDEVTSFAAAARQPIRWLKVELAGGIQIAAERTFFEFSELTGHGTQDPSPLSTAFSGTWQGRGVTLDLTQDGVRVEGCYDDDGELSGTVSGNLLHATGKTRKAGIPSAFLIAVDPEGTVFGVRSTNGAPFHLYTAATTKALRTDCGKRDVAPPGCGAVLHGIQFDFDSAAIRPESHAHLDALYAGLKGEKAAAITIVGHTSSEGSDSYNDRLSEQRAAAVAAALVTRGLAADRIAAAGRGERQPIASNDSEVGRALNRRVAIDCQ